MKIKNGKFTITSKVAYIAGFFDGEGCIRIKHSSQRGNCFYVWVAITNSNKSILEMVKDLFGGQVRKAERAVNKTIYHYLITSVEAVDFLKIINVFLIEKKEQAELAIRFYENMADMSVDEKLKIYQKMRHLKKTDVHQTPELC